jgi:cytochrome c-type biogenesis protein CcmE
MKKNLKIALIVITILALAGAAIGMYLYNLEPKDLGQVKPDFIVTSTELQQSFEEDETAAIAKYVNKIVEVSGEIGSVEKGENNSVNISLKTNNSISSIICTFPSGVDSEKIKEGSPITVRGECSGYLMDVLLNNCVLSEGLK